MAWLEVRQGIDRGVHTSSDLGGGETWPGLRWHINIRTWMELRHCLEGGVMWLHGPGLGWDSTCMEVRLKSLNPDPDEIGPEWRWDTYLESLMGLWGCLYGAEMQFWCPGWGWDVTWMEMRYKHKDLDWGEKPHGWKRGVNQSTWGWWDVNLETWMRMRWDLDWVETHILRLGWDRTIKELRFIYCGIDD